MDFGNIGQKEGHNLVSTASQSSSSASREPKVKPGQSASPYALDKQAQQDSITKGADKPSGGGGAAPAAPEDAAAAPADGSAPAGAATAGAATQDPNAAVPADQAAANPELQTITQAVSKALDGFPPELQQMFMLIAQAYVQKLKQDPGNAQSQAAAATNAGSAIQNNPVVTDPQQRAQLAGAVQKLIQQLNSSFGSGQGAQPQAAQPQVAQSQAAQPQVAQSQAAQPQVAQSQAAQLQVAQR